jgi:nucleoside-diphosphate-sugar epimerase
MRVLVTGNSGYVGQVLVPLLLDAGHEVRGLDTGFFEGGQFLPAPSIEQRALDIRDIKPEHLEGIDAIVFLAALSNDALGDLDPALTHQINGDATVSCARAAKEAGVKRFVFSSSCSLYGKSGDDILTEDAVMNPQTPYGESKINVERKLMELAGDGFSPTYMRNATAYGVSPSLRIDLVVNNLTGYALTTGEVRLQSDGTPWRPLVHVEDIGRAMVAVLDAPVEVIHNQAFNVGITEENYRIREVAEMVAKAVKGSELSFADGAGPDKRDYRVNFDKIKRELPGFKPQWTVEKGIVQLREAYLAEGLTKEDLLSERYLRIKTILRHKAEDRLDGGLRWTTG